MPGPIDEATGGGSAKERGPRPKTNCRSFQGPSAPALRWALEAARLRTKVVFPYLRHSCHPNDVDDIAQATMLSLEEQRNSIWHLSQGDMDRLALLIAQRRRADHFREYTRKASLPDKLVAFGVVKTVSYTEVWVPPIEKPRGVTNREWEAFGLRFLLGFSRTETAQKMDVAVSTIDTLVQRVRTKLRESW